MAAEPQILSSSDGAADPPASLLAMESLEEIKARAEAAVLGAKIDIVPNPGPANQPSLLIDNPHAAAIARFLRDDPALRLDFCSNATGVDWLDRTVKTTVKVKKVVDGQPDLRRILMWDEFTDYPMRKDYREPDDYEFEPTPHDEVLEKARKHYAARPQLDGAENITPRNEAETLKG